MTTYEIIKKYYQAFNEKNYQIMLSLVTEDIIHDTNQGSRDVGKDNFNNFLKRMDYLYDEKLDQFAIMVSEDGQRAAAEFVCHGTYKNTDDGLPPARGQRYDLPVGCFFEIRGGKIARITNYYNMNEWLRMVR